MDTQELFVKDGRSAGVYACGKCHRVGMDKAWVDLCCVPRICQDCNKEEIKKGYTVCEPCFWKHERKKELARFEKATKISDDDYTGPVFNPNNDEFYGDTWEMCDRLLDDRGEDESEDDALPSYVWACDLEPVLHVNVEQIIESACENAGPVFNEEYLEESAFEGVEEFKKAAQAFNDINAKLSLWVPDYSRAVLIKPRALHQNKSLRLHRPAPNQQSLSKLSLYKRSLPMRPRRKARLTPCEGIGQARCPYGTTAQALLQARLGVCRLQRQTFNAHFAHCDFGFSFFTPSCYSFWCDEDTAYEMDIAHWHTGRETRKRASDGKTWSILKMVACRDNWSIYNLKHKQRAQHLKLTKTYIENGLVHRRDEDSDYTPDFYTKASAKNLCDQSYPAVGMARCQRLEGHRKPHLGH